MMATMGEAHAEWHLNAGVPMGQPGCPQDACHLPDPDPEFWALCGHCGEYHAEYERQDLFDGIRRCAEAAHAHAR